MPKIVYIVPNCPPYRVKTYEMLARQQSHIKFFFFSRGDDWYRMPELGVQSGDFDHNYLTSIKIGRWYFTPSLFWRLWNYDIYLSGITGRVSLPLTCLIARLRNKPFILSTGVWHRIKTPFQIMFFPFLRHIYRHADAIVTYGTHVEQYLISEGVNPKRIFSAKHAVDNAFNARPTDTAVIQEIRQTFNIAEHEKIILYVGRLVYEKGVDYLIDAFSSLERDNVHLMIVGTGNYSNHLKTYAKASTSADRIHFVGYIAPKDLAEYYAIADIFVLPSISTPQFKEPWGLVVNEAMNQGAPVITTDAVGAAMGGLVQHDVNGYIVPERDSEALRDYLRLILDDPEKRASFSRHAREIIATWGNEEMVQTFLNVIEFVQQ